MKEGTVIKGIGGFYYVSTDDGIYTCKAKGAFKKDKNILYVGDFVKIRVVDENEKEGFIEEIRERKNVAVESSGYFSVILSNISCASSSFFV